METILSSGLIDGSRVAEIIDTPEDHIESAEFFSWEQFFTKLLISETKDTYLQYSKKHLSGVYLNSKERESLIHVIGVIKQAIGIQ